MLPMHANPQPKIHMHVPCAKDVSGAEVEHCCTVSYKNLALRQSLHCPFKPEQAALGCNAHIVKELLHQW